MSNSKSQAKALPPETTRKVQELLLKMNSQTEYTQDEYRYSSKILSGLVSKDGSVVDISKIVKPVKEIYDGCAKIETKNLVLEINPKSGEILNAKKPFLQSWKKAYDKVEKLVETLDKNFENTKEIERKCLPLSGLTKEGLQKIQKETGR